MIPCHQLDDLLAVLFEEYSIDLIQESDLPSIIYHVFYSSIMAVEVPLNGITEFSVTAGELGQNPFDVEITANFLHESGTSIQHVPGYFDGDGTWTFRFCPTHEGEWVGSISSDIAEFDGETFGIVECVSNGEDGFPGRIRIDPENPRRFRFERGQEFVPLGFEIDWLFSYHQSDPDACYRTVDRLKEIGFNYFITNLYAHTGFSPQERDDVYGPPDEFIFGGSNENPDFDRFNIAFFEDFDRLMTYLHDQGIVVNLMLQVQNKRVNWPDRRSDSDDRFWRYVVSRYAAYPNLIWDIGKESYYLSKETGSHGYSIDRMELIRSIDPYDNLVTVHDSEAFWEDGNTYCTLTSADDVADFVSDQIHLGDAHHLFREATRRFRRDDKPYLNNEYGYEAGVDDIESYSNQTTTDWKDMLAWTWSIYAGGGYPCYYYTNMAWDLIKPEPEPESWPRYRDLSNFLAQFDLNRMIPDRDYVSRGFCLTEPGQQYLIFLPEGGHVRVDLTAVDSVEWGFSCRFLDCFTGEAASTTIDACEFLTPLENPLSDVDHPCAIAIISP